MNIFIKIIITLSLFIVMIKFYTIVLKYIIYKVKFTNNIFIIHKKIKKDIKEKDINELKNNSKYAIYKNKIICQKCNAKNGLKRKYCWICGKKI